MSLPKIETPVFNAKLPLTGLSITYRPLLVKEEKIILIATQANDPDQMRLAVEQILTNCIVSPKDFNVKAQPLADIEYLLIQIRDKSLGGFIESEYTCTNNDCNTKFKIKMEFKDLEIVRGESKDKFQINEKIGIKLKPPSFGVISRISEETSTVFDYELLADAVDFIFDKENTYKFSESTKEEISEFFDSLQKDKLDLIYDFIGSMPKYEINMKHKCINCGFEHEIKVDDLANFFT